MNTRWVTPTIALMLAVSSRGWASPLAIGDSRESVISAIGMPLRELASADGTLLVYNNSFVYLVGGKVDFISLTTPRPETPKGGDLSENDTENDTGSEKGTSAPPGLKTRAKERVQIRPHAFENHPIFAEALQRQREDRRNTARLNTSLEIYWETLRQNFADNSLFDSPVGMVTLKTGDGQTIPAVGESRNAAWNYLEVDLEEALRKGQEAE